MKTYSESELTAIFREVAAPQTPHIWTAHSLVLTPEPVVWVPAHVGLRHRLSHPGYFSFPRSLSYKALSPAEFKNMAAIGENWRNLLLEAAEGDEDLAIALGEEATFGLRYGATMH